MTSLLDKIEKTEIRQKRIRERMKNKYPIEAQSSDLKSPPKKWYHKIFPTNW
ncbi:Uncharacterized protein dnm_092910 [Desulfonema magnum]|uniref:Uncharacterized protein n=1 Tax=Desulfonema magnum TaxID=45655 RepID=A0A975GUT9_9BACT|nr:Uncharacterized protein dnm_092910 [Desulfonema magnum]